MVGQHTVLVTTPETEVECDAGKERRDCDTGVVADEFRILSDR